MVEKGDNMFKCIIYGDEYESNMHTQDILNLLKFCGHEIFEVRKSHGQHWKDFGEKDMEEARKKYNESRK